MSDLTGRIVRYTALALTHKANPERAARERGLCTKIEESIAWIVWDHTYAPAWEYAVNLEAGEGERYERA